MLELALFRIFCVGQGWLGGKLALFRNNEGAIGMAGR